MRNLILILSIVFSYSYGHSQVVTIDFEPNATLNPVEGAQLNNANYLALYNVTFHAGGVGGPAPIYSAPGGNNLTAFGSINGLDCQCGVATSDYVNGNRTPCFFLSDDNNTASTTTITIDFNQTNLLASSVFLDLLDVDAAEVVSVQGFDVLGNATALQTFNASSPGAGDATALQVNVTTTGVALDFITISSAVPALYGIDNIVIYPCATPPPPSCSIVATFEISGICREYNCGDQVIPSIITPGNVTSATWTITNRDNGTVIQVQALNGLYICYTNLQCDGPFPYHVFLDPNEKGYEICLTATDDLGCTSDAFCQIITVPNGPKEYANSDDKLSDRMDENVTIYPNPTDGDIQINFRSETEQKITVEILGADMRIVKTSVSKLQVEQGDQSIRIQFDQKLSSGLYYIRIVGDKSLDEMHKVILQK